MGRGLSNLGCAAQLGIFAVIVIGGLTLLQSLTGAPAALLGSLQAAAPQPTPTTVVLPPVLDVITRQPRLQTVSYFLSTVADSSKVVGLLKQEQRVILVACGKVTAGIELSKLDKDKVKADGADATIQLPDPEIFDTLLIEDRNPPCTYVAFRTDGILLEAAKDLESDARRQAIEKFRQTALEQGIIQEARVNAQTEIRRLLFLAGYKSVEFTP
jgi:hypothetical protein